MENEYYKEFMELQEESTFRGQTWFGERKSLVEQYAWAVPNEKALKYIANFDEEIIEVGAGNGYWAALVEEYGGSVRPIDYLPEDDQYTNVIAADVYDCSDIIEDSVVMMVWPPYDEDMSHAVVDAGPAHVLYVGEQRGGCTGCDKFFDTIDREYGLVGKIDIPSFQGVHDNFYHYVRKV